MTNKRSKEDRNILQNRCSNFITKIRFESSKMKVIKCINIFFFSHLIHRVHYVHLSHQLRSQTVQYGVQCVRFTCAHLTRSTVSWYHISIERVVVFKATACVTPFVRDLIYQHTVNIETHTRTQQASMRFIQQIKIKRTLTQEGVKKSKQTRTHEELNT